jgi:midasin (ATPase involved in ribosome maturation)
LTHRTLDTISAIIFCTNLHVPLLHWPLSDLFLSFSTIFQAIFHLRHLIQKTTHTQTHKMMGRNRRSIVFFLFLVMVMLATHSTQFVAAQEENEVDESAQEAAAAEQRAQEEAAAEAERIRIAKEEAAAEQARKVAEYAEQVRMAAEIAARKEKQLAEEAAAAAKAEAERLAAEAAAAAEAAKKASEGAITKLKTKLFGVTDMVVGKSKSLLEQAKSMSTKQKKQAAAVVAGFGFASVAFIASTGNGGAAAAAQARKK